MIILKSITESLRLITSAVGSTVDCSVSYADITTTTFSPSTSESKIITNTTTTILGVPPGSTQRQVKLITITNIHASTTTTVTVHKYDSAGGTNTYDLTPHVTLLAGEILQYVDGNGWVYYAANGGVKGGYLGAAGSDTQIQYNANGILAGDAGLTWSASGHDLTLGGADAAIIMQGITNEPAAPSAGQLTIYSKAVAGRMLPKWKAPSGVDTSFQSNLGFNTVNLWTPANATTATGLGFGTAWAACTGTITHPATTTGIGNQLRIMQCTNIATTANQILGLSGTAVTLPQFWVGNAVGQGGFFFQCRFKIVLIAATSIRMFVGLTSYATGVVVADTYTGDMCGFDHITTDNITTLSFVTRNNVTTNRATFTVPTLAAGNAYDATIYSPPNGSAIYYRLVDLLTGNVLVDTNTTTNMPRNTIFMGPQVQMSNAANGTVTTTAIGINKIYIESDM